MTKTYSRKKNHSKSKSISKPSGPGLANSGCGRSGKLPDMPYDVVVHVANFLSIREVVRLSMVCKSLRSDLDRNQFVWVRALRHFMSDENIAKFSYVPENMSVDELKQVLSRPWRLRLSVLENRPFKLSRRIFGLDYGPSLGPKLQWGQDFHRTSFLLPGGRWLLTTACDDRTLHVFCWDLQQRNEGKPLDYTTRAAFDQFPVFQDGPSLGRRGEGVTLDAQSSEDCEEVRLLAVYEGIMNGQRSTVFQMATMKWLEEDGTRPTITPTFALTLDNTSQVAPTYALEGDIVCVHQPGSLVFVAWNWRINSVVNAPIRWTAKYISGSTMPLKFWLRPPYAVVANTTLDRFTFLQLPLPEFENSPPSFEIVKPDPRAAPVSNGAMFRAISLLSETEIWKTIPMRGDSWVYCRIHEEEAEHGYAILRPGPFDDVVKKQELAALKVPVSRATKHLAKRFGAASGSNAPLSPVPSPQSHAHAHTRSHSVNTQSHSHSHSHPHSHRGVAPSAADWVETDPIRLEVMDSVRYGLRFDYLGINTDLFFTKIYSTGTQGEFRMSAMNVAEKDIHLDPYVGASRESVIDGVGVGKGYFEIGCSPCALSGTFISHTTNKWNEGLNMPKCVLFFFD